MSFLIKPPTIIPGFAIFNGTTATANTFSFKEGTFTATSGNGTNTLTFGGGFRYMITLDFATPNSLSTFATFYIRAIKTYGSVTVTGNTCASRASSTLGFDQSWMSSICFDAHSDFTLSLIYSLNSQRVSSSCLISIWRFPL